jgi:hypothetical protein
VDISLTSKRRYLNFDESVKQLTTSLTIWSWVRLLTIHSNFPDIVRFGLVTSLIEYGEKTSFGKGIVTFQPLL